MKASAALVALLIGAIASGCLGAESENEPVPVRDQLAGEKIAFVSPRDGDPRDGDAEIFVMNPDGSGLRQLTGNSSGARQSPDDGSPAWSPDGRMIAFTSRRDKKGGTGEDSEVYVIKRDGRGERRLSDAKRTWTST